MMERADRILAAARGMVGVPFRLHGRSRETGVDCIGLALLALADAGWRQAGALSPPRYSMRGGHPARFENGLRAAGLRPVRKGRPGDLVLVQAGVAQVHLMIATGDGHVHAHAGLGQVVEMPGPSPWPVIGHYRWGK